MNKYIYSVKTTGANTSHKITLYFVHNTYGFVPSKCSVQWKEHLFKMQIEIIMCIIISQVKYYITIKN